MISSLRKLMLGPFSESAPRLYMRAWGSLLVLSLLHLALMLLLPPYAIGIPSLIPVLIGLAFGPVGGLLVALPAAMFGGSFYSIPGLPNVVAGLIAGFAATRDSSSRKNDAVFAALGVVLSWGFAAWTYWDAWFISIMIPFCLSDLIATIVFSVSLAKPLKRRLLNIGSDENDQAGFGENQDENCGSSG